MASAAFSLLRECWLPVVRVSGQRDRVQLSAISEHNYECSRDPILRIATGRPDCDTSLTEFLIGLLAVTIGPKTRRDWVPRYIKPPSRDELQAAFAPFEAALICFRALAWTSVTESQPAVTM